MGKPRRRNPFLGIIDHMSEMNRMREYVEGIGVHEDRQRTHANAWVPITDIFARGSDLVIRCELAGVDEEHVEISLSNDTLTISGDRESGLEDEEVTFYTRERSYGHFRRSMSLPGGVREEDVSATFENGMLEIVIRGAADAVPEPRRIRITRKK